MNGMQIIEWAASLFGVIGVFIVTSKQAKYRKWRLTSFTFGIISNVFMLIFCIYWKHWGVLAFNTIMFFLSARGIINNLHEEI
jgi:predicted ferric reductase